MYRQITNRILTPIALSAVLSGSGCAELEADELSGSEAQVADPSALQVQTGEIPDVVFGEVLPGGPGCKRDTFRTFYLDSQVGLGGYKTFSVFYDDFRVDLDAEKAIGFTSCVLRVPIRVPKGWQFAITQFAFRGEVSLVSGMRALIDIGYGFAGKQAIQLSSKTPLNGPLFGKRFEIMDTVPLAELGSDAWSSCSDYRDMIVTTSVYAENVAPPKSGFVLISETEGAKADRAHPGTEVRVGGQELVSGTLEKKSGLFLGVEVRRCPD